MEKGELILTCLFGIDATDVYAILNLKSKLNYLELRLLYTSTIFLKISSCRVKHICINEARLDEKELLPRNIGINLEYTQTLSIPVFAIFDVNLVYPKLWRLTILEEKYWNGGYMQFFCSESCPMLRNLKFGSFTFMPLRIKGKQSITNSFYQISKWRERAWNGTLLLYLWLIRKIPKDVVKMIANILIYCNPKPKYWVDDPTTQIDPDYLEIQKRIKKLTHEKRAAKQKLKECESELKKIKN